jgi:hypothetical protein
VNHEFLKDLEGNGRGVMEIIFENPPGESKGVCNSEDRSQKGSNQGYSG